MNRAERRRQDKCAHDWREKVWPDGVGMRLCHLCHREEWHDSKTRFA